MKILLVSLYHVEYAVELANALGRRNHVHLILSDHRVRQTVRHRLHSTLTSNIKYTLLRKGPLWTIRSWKSIFNIFKILFTTEYDVVHIQDSSNLFNQFFLSFSRGASVITVHDVVMHPGCHLSPWRLRDRNRLLTNYYDKIIVHGNKLKKLFLNHHKRLAEDIFAIPHGCLFSYVPAHMDHAPEEEPHSILFFGRMKEYKGLAHLIEAEPLVSKEIPDFKIIVAGKGEDLDLYKPVIATNPHFEIIDNHIPNSDVPYFFQRASVVILPYIEASQSGIVAIAFAFRKPVIVTDVGSLSEVVDDGKVGLVIPPNNIDVLVHAILSLLQDKQKRLMMRKEITRLIEAKLSWERIAHLTEGVYVAAQESHADTASIK